MQDLLRSALERHQAGELAQAALLYQAALALDPENPEAIHLLGVVHLQQGDNARAVELIARSVVLRPSVPGYHANLAEAYRASGRYDQALSALRRASELDPTNGAILETLGQLLFEEEEYAESARVFKRVAAHFATERMTTRLWLGWALQEDGRAEEALVHYQKAVALKPESGEARTYVGSCHEERGEFALAESSYRAAIALEPAFVLPYARLATMLGGELPDSDQAALEQWLEDRSLNDEARGRILFSLAHVLDARGEYAQAAVLLREANALTLGHKRKCRGYDPAEHARFVDDAIQTFSPGFFQVTRDLGLSRRLPVFIFGLPRSGTTLIEQILSSHPRVHGAGELRIARSTFELLPLIMGLKSPPFACVSLLDPTTIEAAARLHLHRMLEFTPAGFDRVSDKMPENYLFLGLLATLFPQATLIHCRRDLRDVAVSCWVTDFRALYWASDPRHIGARFEQYLRIMDHWREVLPQPILEIDYERTVVDLEGVARQIVAACGLEWSPDCLEFHRAERSIRTASLTQARKPVYTRSVGRWKHYETHLADLLEALPRVDPGPGA